MTLNNPNILGILVPVAASQHSQAPLVKHIDPTCSVYQME